MPSFCEQNNVDRFHVDRLLRGTVKRCPPADIVDDIHRATAGRVISSMWREDTLRDDEAGEVPGAPESGSDLDVDDEPASDGATGTEG